jgi:hypothetical protein
MSPSSDDASLGRLTALDWIAVVLTTKLVVALELFPHLIAPRFAAMFADLGTVQLPLLTRLTLSVWFPTLLALLPLGMVVTALARRQVIARRRGLIVVAFLFGLAALGVCVVGTYLPVLQLAASV